VVAYATELPKGATSGLHKSTRTLVSLNPEIPIIGLPLMVAIIGGEPKRFRPLIDLYREAGRRAGHSDEKLIVGLHAIGFLGNTTQEAADDFYPGYAHTFTKIGKERGWPRRRGLSLMLCEDQQAPC
jgi:hypothetical protein